MLKITVPEAPTSDKIGLELKSVKVGLRSLISFKTTVTA
jgi:hypothetical protein